MNLRILPIFNLVGNSGFVLEIVLIPPLSALMDETPILRRSDWIVSAVNVDAAPAIEDTDFTSDIPKVVMAVATLVFSIPLKINGSFFTNSPFLSYTVKAVPAETEFDKKAVAPLYFPRTKVGIVSVIGSFSVISEKVWTSYKEIFHSLIFKFSELYEPESSLKS